MPETVSPLRSVAPSGRRRADAHVGDVPQQHRRAVCSHVSTMLPKSSVRHRAARAQQRVLLRGMLDVAAAEIRVVVLDARGHVVQRQAVLLQQRGVDHDLKLLGLAAPGVDFADAGNGAQLAA